MACREGTQRAISTTRNGMRETARQHAKIRPETIHVEPSNPRSKNKRHSTPHAPIWTRSGRAVRAHSAPYRPHGMAREPQPASTPNPGQKRCTHRRAILDQSCRRAHGMQRAIKVWSTMDHTTEECKLQACSGRWASSAGEHVQCRRRHAPRCPPSTAAEVDGCRPTTPSHPQNVTPTQQVEGGYTLPGTSLQRQSAN